MMKSFFKKLSLVMALAMVVSMVTPAANAFAAEAGITLQGSKTVITETINMELGGADVDFAFEGAPKDWKTTYKWTSSDETIAKVNTAGVVTALKAGEATITLTAGADGSYKHSVKVVITEPVDANAFTVKQKSHNTFAVNFNKEVSYSKAEDVYLYRVFNTEDGDVYAVWAVKDAKLSDDKKTLTVTPYVQFGDGDRYLVAFEDIENQLNKGNDLKGVNYYEFTTIIGEIDSVQLSWASYDTSDDERTKIADNKAYTNGEDADYDIEVELSAKLFCGDIDLTEIYKNDGYMEYTLKNEDDVADYVVLSDNILVFTKENKCAVVEAKYVFENAEGEEDFAPSLDTPIISTKQDPFSISYVSEWSFISDENKVDWNKPDHDVRAGKTAQIALLLKDSRGGQWETFDSSDKINNFGTKETADMYLHFYSTDNDHFLISDVSEDEYENMLGEVETYIKMKKAVVYVALHDTALTEEDYESDFVSNIGACVMEITDPSSLNSLAVYKGDDQKTSVTLVTNAVEDDLSGRFMDEFTTAKFTVKLVDQDGKPYDCDEDPVLENTYVEYKMTTTNKQLREYFEGSDAGIDGVLGLSGEDNSTRTLTIDANALGHGEEEYTKSSSVTVTITATQYDEEGEKIDSAKTTFKVYLRDPELFDEDDQTANKIPEGWELGDVNPASWGLSTGNVGLMPTNGKSSAEIEVSMLSKSYTVGYYNRFEMNKTEDAAIGDGITIAKSVEEYKFNSGSKLATAPGIYVLVTDPDGKVVAETTTQGALGVYVAKTASEYKNSPILVNVTGDSNGDGVVEYLKTGKYTVKVTVVKSVATKLNAEGETVVDTIDSKTKTTNFTVTNDIDKVEFKGMIDVETSDTITVEEDGDRYVATDLDQLISVIADNYKFEYDKTNKSKMEAWNPEEETSYGSIANIADVNCIIRGDYITIKSITFEMNAGNGKVYRTTTTDINRAVKLGVEE